MNTKGDATMTHSQRNTQGPAAVQLQTISMDQAWEQVRRARTKRQAVVAEWISPRQTKC